MLEIPLVAGRVQEALALSESDPAHPGQLLLGVQDHSRPELFALEPVQLLEMAQEVIELGSRRRALLFMRADQLGHFVSCLVYLPRDRYTTAVRLAMQDILTREFGDEDRLHRPGQRIALGCRPFHCPAARCAGQLPIDTTDTNRIRIQELLTAAARTWADRLGSVPGGAIDRVVAEHYAEALPEEFKQAVTPRRPSTTSVSWSRCPRAGCGCNSNPATPTANCFSPGTSAAIRRR